MRKFLSEERKLPLARVIALLLELILRSKPIGYMKNETYLRGMNTYSLLIINYQLSASVMGNQSRNLLGHCKKRAESGLSVQLLRASGSPRAFSPRDDKSGIFTMKGVKWWSSHIVIARRTGWTTRQSVVAWRMPAEMSVRLPGHSGSPRAMPSR